MPPSKVASFKDCALVFGSNIDRPPEPRSPAATKGSLRRTHATIDLVTGAATLVGTIGCGEVIRGSAIAVGNLTCTVPPRHRRHRRRHLRFAWDRNGGYRGQRRDLRHVGRRQACRPRRR